MRLGLIPNGVSYPVPPRNEDTERSKNLPPSRSFLSTATRPNLPGRIDLVQTLVAKGGEEGGNGGGDRRGKERRQRYVGPVALEKKRGRGVQGAGEKEHGQVCHVGRDFSTFSFFSPLLLAAIFSAAFCFSGGDNPVGRGREFGRPLVLVAVAAPPVPVAVTCLRTRGVAVEHRPPLGARGRWPGM